MVKIEKINDPSSLPAGWDEYVENHNYGTIFHTRDWAQTIIESYGYDFLGLIARGDNGRIAGLLAAFIVYSKFTGNRVISMPFSYICRPLSDDNQVESLLIEEIEKAVGELNLDYYEIKSQNEIEYAGEKYSVYGGYSTFTLNIDRPEEILWKSFHKNMIRRGIKKAENSGIEIRPCSGEDEMNEFYRLNLLTSRKNGVPSQPRLFFYNVLKNLIKKEKAALLMAFYGNKAIAGIVLYFYKDVAVYMYGASDTAYLKYRPNHLLLWEGIKISKEKGIKIFDFGRVSEDNKGLADFKRRWGTTEVRLHYYYWPQKKGIGSVDRSNIKYRIAKTIITNSPLFIFKRLSFFYRHLA